jgi:hypothetical protein
VSVFAAGCAICGADLERHRRELESSLLKVPVVPDRVGGRHVRGLRGRLDAHAALVAFTILAMLLSPFLGVILALLGVQDRHRSGQIGQRNLFIGLAVLGVVLSLVPAVRFGIWSLIS